MNCYDVIGENDAKTEGTLRARFERASSCSPCVLLLRNIDAFAQTTQGLEPGKGNAALTSARRCTDDPKSPASRGPCKSV